MEANAVELSIVIPARNAATTISAQLDAIVVSTKPDVAYEVIVADNGSTDDTSAIAASYADRLPLRVVDASRAAGINVARNVAVRASTGTYVAFCDADDEVDEQWLVCISRAFREGNELVAGPIDYRRLNRPEVRAWRGAERASVCVAAGFLPAGHGANMGVTRRLFDELDGFDEAFVHGGDDLEFFWRAQLAGTPLHEVPDAIVHYGLRSTLRAHWKQCVNYGACEPALYARFAKAGMPRRPPCAFARDLWWLASRLPFAWPERRRGAWLRRCGVQYGRIRGAIRHHVAWW